MPSQFQKITRVNRPMYCCLQFSEKLITLVQKINTTLRPLVCLRYVQQQHTGYEVLSICSCVV